MGLSRPAWANDLVIADVQDKQVCLPSCARFGDDPNHVGIYSRHCRDNDFETCFRILVTEYRLESSPERICTIRRACCSGGPQYEDSISIVCFVNRENKRFGCPRDVWTKEAPGDLRIVIVRWYVVDFVLNGDVWMETVISRA